MIGALELDISELAPYVPSLAMLSCGTWEAEQRHIRPLSLSSLCSRSIRLDVTLAKLRSDVCVGNHDGSACEIQINPFHYLSEWLRLQKNVLYSTRRVNCYVHMSTEIWRI